MSNEECRIVASLRSLDSLIENRWNSLIIHLTFVIRHLLILVNRPTEKTAGIEFFQYKKAGNNEGFIF